MLSELFYKTYLWSWNFLYCLFPITYKIKVQLFSIEFIWVYQMLEEFYCIHQTFTISGFSVSVGFSVTEIFSWYDGRQPCWCIQQVSIAGEIIFSRNNPQIGLLWSGWMNPENATRSVWDNSEVSVLCHFSQFPQEIKL